MDVAAHEPPPAAAAPAPRPSTWALLAENLGAATDPRKLLLAALGLVALWAGWSVLGLVFGTGPLFWPPTAPPEPAVVHFVMPTPPTPPELPAKGEEVLISITNDRPPVAGVFSELARQVAEPPQTLMAPFASLFATFPHARGFFHALLAAAWAAAVWGVIGGAIARIAAVQLAAGERVGMLTALRFALKHALALVGAPLSPLIGVALLALPCAVLGFVLYQLPGAVGTTIAGALAFLPLLIAVPLALLVLGLAVGWPLMTATVAVDGEDGFDALSRSYAYASQRPIAYAWYLAVSWVLGIAGVFAVGLFAHLVVHLAEWSLAFGAPDARLHRLFAGPADAADPPAAFHAFWLGAVALLARGWAYAYFWTAATRIYLLLRRDVDGTPCHEVYQPEHDADEFAPSLPPTAPTPTTTPTLPEIKGPAEGGLEAPRPESPPSAQTS